MTEQLPTLPYRLSAATLKLIQSRPLVVWMGGLTLMLSVAAIAGTGLLSPGPVEEETETAEVVVPPTPVQTPELPFWFFGVLALGCMGGSWLIAHYLLTQTPPNRPVPRRTAPPPQTQATDFSQSHPRVEPVVTVMSAEETHPLDGTEDLAEIMDIRKRKPLSNVLRGY